jgi:hypothetical protein
MKRSDELGVEVSAEGDVINVIEGSWTDDAAIVPKIIDPEPESPKYTTIRSLLVERDAETILAANEGKIPGTVEECQAVAEKLGAES